MTDISFLWNGFEPLLRILLVGILCYIALVVTLKVSGKRTLASLTAFDFVITVTLGAVFGRVLTAKDVSISEAITAFILLAFLQFLFSWMQMKSKLFRKFFTSRPILLYYKGEFMEKRMRSARIAKSELIGAARKKGYGDLDEVEIIIFENDASISVIGKLADGKNATYNEFIDP